MGVTAGLRSKRSLACFRQVIMSEYWPARPLFLGERSVGFGETFGLCRRFMARTQFASRKSGALKPDVDRSRVCPRPKSADANGPARRTF